MKFFGCDFTKQKRHGRDGRDKEWEILFAALTTIIDKEKKIMAELVDLKADADLAAERITTLNTTLDGVRVAMDAVKTELENLKNAGLTPEQKAMVDETHAKLITVLGLIDETIAENPPVNPTPPPDGDVV